MVYGDAREGTEVMRGTYRGTLLVDYTVKYLSLKSLKCSLPGNVPGGVRVQAHPILFEGVEVVLVDAEALVVLRGVFAGRLKHDEGVEDDSDEQVQKDTKHHDEKPEKKRVCPRPRPTIACEKT